ncbi:glycoside hydrolase family 10 protein [Romboutsia sp. 1001713B170207_170306_H8]|uniref:glycoside hydrolase family 10 protein n=1 Tax=Romboutsia sp. 1001713B170207_170306_H8 TaxID=2787112 RepID=UPI000822447C|nr:family 10 glycosylhydrolase [Romboutsia sp. 1001713B170207_170306_H8]SCI12067.1 Uncharacterized protein conserved in bacteria [uncultured Clostridium sp.]
MNDNCKNIELRGVWIATVYNIDWPKTLNNKEKQKQEFINILNIINDLNFNSVFVQIRPSSDAFYKSCINPWSKYITGEQGCNPGYDPLEFMIEESHKRNIEFHAWLNPYRVTTKGINLNELSDNNMAKLHPDWLLSYNDALFYNPANINVIKYIGDTVFEIISNYDVDGIHFDDYFYPYNYPLPYKEDKNGIIGNSRRNFITQMIKMVNNIVKKTNPRIQFGVSPFDIWKNKASDTKGSNTNGSESYYSVFADSVKWIEEEIIDYIAPQIYWTIDNKNAPYEELVKWWLNITKGTNVKLYIGENISNTDISKEISKQIDINRSYEEVNGNILFSMSSIENNECNIIEQIRSSYFCKDKKL